jgi:hypothetical protein
MTEQLDDQMIRELSAEELLVICEAHGSGRQQEYGLSRL